MVTFVVRGSVKSTFMRLNVIVISTDKLREERSVAAAAAARLIQDETEWGEATRATALKRRNGVLQSLSHKRSLAAF